MNEYGKRGKKYLLLSSPFVVISIIMFVMTGGEFSIIAVVAIFFIIVFFVLFGMGVNAFSTATEMFKVNVVTDALSGIIDGCVYKSKQSITRKQIEATNLVNGWNRFHGEDYITGMYHEHQIEFSDILLEKEYTNNKDEKRTDTIFEGHWITCRLAKKLPAIIRLSEGAGKGNAETENVAFNNKYKIYTDDLHYMFYVLTPHFMEYIIAADEAANAKTYFYFADDMVHIAVHNRGNVFEIKNADKNNPKIARERVKSEMKYVFGILDEILRNEILFKEE